MKTINKKINVKKEPCGLCSKKNETCDKTECCGNWVCGDESEYVLFSHSRKICCRNHRRFTLCAYHNTEEHKGDWKDCKKCLNDFRHELEMYVWYGTNKYNFEKLPNPPKFEPTHCSGCKKVICLPDGGYGTFCGKYACDECTSKGFELRK